MCSCCNAPNYGQSERYFFVRAFENLVITPLTRKQLRNSKQSAALDYILLKGHDTILEDFTILLTENYKFTLHLKESLLIKCHKQELNRNINSYISELFN